MSASCVPGAGSHEPIEARFQGVPPPRTNGPAISPTDVVMLSPRIAFLTTGSAYGTAAGRIQRTLDGGDTWTTVWSRRRAGLEHIAFADRRHGLAIGWIGERPIAVRTHDGGATWRLERPRLPRGGAHALLGLEPTLVDADFGYAVADPAAFMFGSPRQTTDGGRTWRRARLPDDVDFVGRSLAYGVGRFRRDGCSGIWKTTDGGRRWRLLRCSAVPLYSVDFVDAERGFVGGGHALVEEHGPSQLVLRTTDGGKTWRRIYIDRLGGFRHGVSPPVKLLFTDAMHGWARTGACKCCPSGSCAGEVMTTADGGRTWRRNGWAVRLAAGGARTALRIPRCDDECGVLWRTRDGARTWQPLAGAGGLNLSRVLAMHPGLYLETFDDAQFVSQDGGRTWQFLAALSGREEPTWQSPVAVRPGLVAIGTRVARGVGVAISRDAGRTFHTGRLGRGEMDVFGVAFADSEHGVATTGTYDYSGRCAGGDGATAIHATQDGGRSWRRQPRPPIVIADVGYAPGLLAATGRLQDCKQLLALSRDAGRTWKSKPLTGTCAVSVAPGDAIWLQCGAILRVSADGGESWREFRIRPETRSLSAVDEKEAWLVTGAGRGSLWHTSDGGASWQQVWPSLPTP